MLVVVAKHDFIVGHRHDNKNADPVAHLVVGMRLVAIDRAQAAEILQAEPADDAIARTHEKVEPRRRGCRQLQRDIERAPVVPALHDLVSVAEIRAGQVGVDPAVRRYAADPNLLAA